MKAFIAFTKKEFTESLRTYRLIVLAAVFLLLGLMSPLTAKLLPEIMGSIDLGDGVFITMPEASAMSSWEQFFGYIGQMGMLALIITFGGLMANELSRGTLINLLTKGMKRQTVILSKFLTASVLWAGSYALSLAVCYAYTAFFWPGGVLSNAFLAFFSLWLFGEFLIALLIFGGVLFGNFYGSLLGCFGVIIILSTLNLFPALSKFNPSSLAAQTLNLLSAQKEAADYLPAFIICAAAAALLVAAAIAVFNKRRV
ncbi:MAG: ABC transporter permease [Clostridiales bacterium]|nr:ABC transporter permease [Clostridiales bacterium]